MHRSFFQSGRRSLSTIAFVTFLMVGSACAQSIRPASSSGETSQQTDRASKSANEGANGELEFAVLFGDVERARKALDAGADPNSASNGRPVLSLAASLGHADVVVLLLEHGARPNESGEQDAPLLVAVEKGCLECVRRLLEYRADPNVPAVGTGLTPLYKAADVPEMVELLIGKGANVNANVPYFGSPLIWSLATGPARTVEILLEKGADPNAADPTGGGPPFTKPQYGKTQSVFGYSSPVRRRSTLGVRATKRR